MMPLSRQEEFFVREFTEEEVSIATTEFSVHSTSQGKISNSSSRQPDNVSSSSGRQGSVQPPAGVSSDEDLFVKPTSPVEKKGKGGGVGKKSTQSKDEEKKR